MPPEKGGGSLYMSISGLLLVSVEAKSLMEVPEWRDWLWMELDEFFFHLLAGLGVTGQTRLMNFWKRAQEAADEGP
jgi:hypothetical protein